MDDTEYGYCVEHQIVNVKGVFSMNLACMHLNKSGGKSVKQRAWSTILSAPEQIYHMG